MVYLFFIFFFLFFLWFFLFCFSFSLFSRKRKRRKGKVSMLFSQLYLPTSNDTYCENHIKNAYENISSY